MCSKREREREREQGVTEEGGGGGGEEERERCHSLRGGNLLLLRKISVWPNWRQLGVFIYDFISFKISEVIKIHL